MKSIMGNIMCSNVNKNCDDIRNAFAHITGVDFIRILIVKKKYLAEVECVCYIHCIQEGIMILQVT